MRRVGDPVDEEEMAQEEETEELKAPPTSGKLFAIPASKRGEAAKVFMIGAVALIMFGIVIYSYVQLNEVYSDISDATTELDELQSENVRMQTELEGQASLSNIKEYAEDELGLQQLDKSQIQYVEVQTEDEVEIDEEDQNIFVTIKNKFEDFIAYLQG